MSNKIFSPENFIIEKTKNSYGVIPSPEIVAKWIAEYAKQYAAECCKATLEKGFERLVKDSMEYEIGHPDNKASITHPDNITLL